tara:strand:- start:1036 stop:1329 length:294 start_codon:yes stop_codon:yes gene_type:complete
MSDKYIVITTITHTRNTYVVNLDQFSRLDLNVGVEGFFEEMLDKEDVICSTELSEDVVAFAIKDYHSVVEHLETTESKDAANDFQEIEIESDYDKKF